MVFNHPLQNTLLLAFSRKGSRAGPAADQKAPATRAGSSSLELRAQGLAAYNRRPMGIREMARPAVP